MGSDKSPARLAARGRRRRGWAIALVVAGAVVYGGWLVWPQIAAVKSPHAMPQLVGTGPGRPQPLGHPPSAPHGVGTFGFVADQVMTDDPVTYEPCRRIGYSIHEQLAPPGSDKIVKDAVRQVSRATGLVFVRRPYVDRQWTVDSLTTKWGHNPVIIDWTTPSDIPALRGRTAGLGRSVYTTDGATAVRYYVTGAIALDAHQLGRTLKRPNGGAQVRADVMRELGRVVGLDYVQDEHELMDPSGGRTTFGPGDREGLAALGSGPCF